MVGQISSKCILTRLDVAKTLNNSGRLPGKVIIRGILSDRGNFDGGFAGIINPGIRSIGRNFELHIKVITDTNNDDSVTCLGDAVSLKFIQIGIELISSISHLVKNLGKCLSVIRIF